VNAVPYEIITIANKVVNCYLIKSGNDFFMVDTGMSFARGTLKKALAAAACKPGSLKLVIITHGDYDHTGNCVYLKEKYGAKIAVHRNEAGVLEKGDMLFSRRSRQGVFFRAELKVARLLMGRPFKPDVLVVDGDDLSPHGFAAKVVHTPGHTTGSISVLTAGGDLFCGDFLVNSGKPEKNSLVDDPAEMDESVLKLKNLDVRKIYPGHGQPFTLEEFLENNR